MCAEGDDWDRLADRFDDEPDHGLRDPGVRAAWTALLLPLMPDPPARILDLGCGTGSLAVLLAQAGHEVAGIDASTQMLALARAKAAARLTVTTGEGATRSRSP